MDILKNRGESATPFKASFDRVKMDSSRFHEVFFDKKPSAVNTMILLSLCQCVFHAVPMPFCIPWCHSEVQQEIAMPPEAPTDFAVGLHLSEKHGVVFMITKAPRGTAKGHWGQLEHRGLRKSVGVTG